jgi:hypothetical protein
MSAYVHEGWSHHRPCPWRLSADGPGISKRQKTAGELIVMI